MRPIPGSKLGETEPRAAAMDEFLAAMKRRYACKLYDRAAPLSDGDVSFILECARLSPSSFGLEHWHLFAARTPGSIARLRAACFDQDAVGTASLVVVAACRRAPAYDPEGSFIRERGSRFPGGLENFVSDFRGYYEYLSQNGLLDHWARAQCYIACANMMTGAAFVGIDSCAIEGFEDGAVLDSLNLDAERWETGIITVFGRAAEPIFDTPPTDGDSATGQGRPAFAETGGGTREKIRMPIEEIVSYV